MDFGILTRFYRLTPGAALTRLSDEAKLRGHRLHVVRPIDVRLRESSAGVTIRYLNQSWQKLNLLTPLLRWDDDYGWELLSEFDKSHQKIVKTPRLPQGNRNEMNQIFNSLGLHTPPTYILNRTQVWQQRKTLPWPMVLRARVNHGQRLVRKITDWAALDECLHEFDNVIEEPLYLLGRQALVGEYVSVLVLADKLMGAHIRQDGLQEISPSMQRKASKLERLIPTMLTKEETRVVTSIRKLYGVMLAGVDFVRTPHGPLILEVNIAPSLVLYERTCASNVARKAIDIMEFIASKK